ncbi:MAG: insulinase family protein [Clostridia bacterium]|nr:insulinase family protein [Clostridia bacterium]
MQKQTFESPLGQSYVKAVLPNGLQIYIFEKPQYTTVHAIFGTHYGSIDTTFSKNGGKEITVPEGIAHFLEHKLFESEDGDAFTRFAETGAYANAYTSFDRTCYLFSCSNRFDENLDILLDFVQSPYFTAQTVQKEQGIIGQEIRMYEDNPGWRVLFNLLGKMFPSHPVHIDIAGTADSIAQIDDKLLYQCYETFYNPANMFICIAGNVDTEKVLKKIESGIRQCAPVQIKRSEFIDNEPVTEHLVTQELDVAIPMFCYGFKQKIDSPERSLKTRICMSLLLELLCGDASPLYARLIRMGLINDEFDSEYFIGHGYATVLFSGESNDPERVAAEITKEIGNLRENGLDKKMFSAAKCSLYGSAVCRFDSVEAMASQLTECAVADFNLFDEFKLLKSVTIDDVYKLLESFDDDNTVLSLILPRAKSDEAEEV